MAEVTNTPWGQSDCQVLDLESSQGETARGEKQVTQAKAFHVAPFMPTDQTYTFTVGAPGEELGFRIESTSADDQLVFGAGFSLDRIELSARSMAWALIRYPFMTAKVTVGIYFQALILGWRGARFHSHPGGQGGFDALGETVGS